MARFLLFLQFEMYPDQKRPHRRSRTLLRVLPVGALLLCATEASAFKLKSTSSGAPIQWQDDQVAFAPIRSGDGRRDALLKLALRAAVEAWKRVSTLRLAVVDESPNPVRWSGDEWAHDPAFLAVTLTRYDVDTGRIVSAEIVVNEVSASWADRAMEPSRAGHFDVQNMLTHEVGHAVGLGHSEVDEATMYPSADADETSKRYLAKDDIDAVAALYGELPGTDVELDLPPIGADSQPVLEAAVGCSSVEGASPTAWVLYLLGVGVLLLRRRWVPGVLCLASSAFLVTSTAYGSPSARPEAGAVLARSELVFQGQVVSQHTEWRPGDLVVTVSQIRVETCLKGTCPPVLIVQQLGGEYGNLGLLVSGITPLPKKGRVLLATNPSGPSWRLAGEDQGQLYVESAKSGPSNLSESMELVREQLGAFRTKPAPAVPPTTTSTPAKGVLRQ